MRNLAARLEQLERRQPRVWRPAPWEPPTRGEVAASLAPILAVYAACGLLASTPLDEAGILALCGGMEWPAATHEPASLQAHRLLQAVLAGCGVRLGGDA